MSGREKQIPQWIRAIIISCGDEIVAPIPKIFGFSRCALGVKSKENKRK